LLISALLVVLALLTACTGDAPGKATVHTTAPAGALSAQATAVAKLPGRRTAAANAPLRPLPPMRPVLAATVGGAGAASDAAAGSVGVIDAPEASAAPAGPAMASLPGAPALTRAQPVSQPAESVVYAPPLVNAPAGPSFNWAETENYLILGTDRRAKGGSWRTDSIMVVGIDRENDRAAVFSVPRDLYVHIPGYGWGRINQADYMGERREPDGGGPKLVSAILEENLGISTEHWVRVQMDGFIRFVDTMGGVDIFLDCPFSEPIFNISTNNWESFTLPAGVSHLDGQDAYWFARLRYRESDIGRSSRQRALIWALREQVLSTDALKRLPQLYTTFQDTISTDLSLVKMITLARWATGLDAANVRASGLSLRDLQNYTTEGGAQVLVIGDPGHVRDLVEGVWEAPAMADAYRKDGAECSGGIVAAEPTAVPESEATEAPAAPAEDAPAEDVPENMAAQPTISSDVPAISHFSMTAPPMDAPDGIIFDPVTGFPIDPMTGLPFDPETEEYVNPLNM
jgi:LCP family protein required for cell wall assembly